MKCGKCREEIEGHLHYGDAVKEEYRLCRVCLGRRSEFLPIKKLGRIVFKQYKNSELTSHLKTLLNLIDKKL